MNELAVQIGERLFNRRKELGLTQKQTAALLGISGSWYGLIERGARGITVEMALDICRTMDIDPTYLLTGDRRNMFIRLIEEFPEDARPLVEELVRGIVKLAAVTRS